MCVPASLRVFAINVSISFRMVCLFFSYWVVDSDFCVLNFLGTGVCRVV